MAYADIESITIAWLADVVFTATGTDRVRVSEGGTGRPQNLRHAERLVTVEHASSSPGDADMTVDVVDLEVAAFARTRARARELASQTRAALRYQFEKYTDVASGAFIMQVRATSPPIEAPWEARDTTRFVAVYRLWVHHNPLA